MTIDTGRWLYSVEPLIDPHKGGGWGSLYRIRIYPLVADLVSIDNIPALTIDTKTGRQCIQNLREAFKIDYKVSGVSVVESHLALRVLGSVTGLER